MEYYFNRNLLISNYNIHNLKGKLFTIGEAKFLGTGDCKPCKKIENLLGRPMYDAMQGMGGITAIVEETGIIKIKDNEEKSFFVEEGTVEFVNNSLLILSLIHISEPTRPY